MTTRTSFSCSVAFFLLLVVVQLAFSDGYSTNADIETKRLKSNKDSFSRLHQEGLPHDDPKKNGEPSGSAGLRGARLSVLTEEGKDKTEDKEWKAMSSDHDQRLSSQLQRWLEDAQINFEVGDDVEDGQETVTQFTNGILALIIIGVCLPCILCCGVFFCCWDAALACIGMAAD